MTQIEKKNGYNRCPSIGSVLALTESEMND